jgi:hypothetical protein
VPDEQLFLPDEPTPFVIGPNCRADLTRSESTAGRLKKLSLTVGDWLYIEQNYKYKRVGLHRRVIEKHVRQNASTSATKVGQLLSLAGIDDPQAQLDRHRKVAKGSTYELLERVTQRRNKIVHTPAIGRAGHAPRPPLPPSRMIWPVSSLSWRQSKRSCRRAGLASG